MVMGCWCWWIFYLDLWYFFCIFSYLVPRSFFKVFFSPLNSGREWGFRGRGCSSNFDRWNCFLAARQKQGLCYTKMERIQKQMKKRVCDKYNFVFEFEIEFRMKKIKLLYVWSGVVVSNLHFHIFYKRRKKRSSYSNK